MDKVASAAKMAIPKSSLAVTVVVITVGLISLVGFAPMLVEQRPNTVNPGTLNLVSQQAAPLYASLLIADRHSELKMGTYRGPFCPCPSIWTACS